MLALTLVCRLATMALAAGIWNSAAGAAQVTLARNGNVLVDVVVAEQASQRVKPAAGDLAAYSLPYSGTTAHVGRAWVVVDYSSWPAGATPMSVAHTHRWVDSQGEHFPTPMPKAQDAMSGPRTIVQEAVMNKWLSPDQLKGRATCTSILSESGAPAMTILNKSIEAEIP